MAETIVHKMDSILRDEVAKKREEFDRYTESHIASLDKENDFHSQRMRHHNGEAQQLVENEKKYQEMAEQLRMRLEEERAELERCKERLEELKSEEATITPELAKVEGEVHNVQKEVDVLSTETKRHLAAREYRMKEMTKGIKFYQERLGLNFMRSSDGVMKFEFVNINPENPGKVYSFTLTLCDSAPSGFKITNSSPTIENADEIVANMSDFGKIVITMRSAFRKHALGE
mmetsp:Transcript_4939/g.13876  ORF Transcript_4939/g.13876 Transcript_4939/m.13876 type:complete len:231 (-) Transcript_4939:32-724(-)|eukprot:CAMPEP_0119149262 /NCGR_PEP_ID=MMETSP1310-20130426/43072_1 /TAXON_ID=464262 /ORGANISM="Genus nov. species nov., Strain RCC2339" /LENGTH=230 /DNA_ID=CAMNT_0007141365 /DNA_START=17 /DNA_END=709 /DNA_ORIENTATION=+